MTTASKILSGFRSLNQELATKGANTIRNGHRAIKIKAIKQFTTGMSESEEASVILKENDNEIIGLIWDRLLRHQNQVRSDEMGLGRKRLVREQSATRARTNECSLILSQIAGNSCYFWQTASRQAVGFNYAAGW